MWQIIYKTTIKSYTRVIQFRKYLQAFRVLIIIDIVTYSTLDCESIDVILSQLSLLLEWSTPIEREYVWREATLSHLMPTFVVAVFDYSDTTSYRQSSTSAGSQSTLYHSSSPSFCCISTRTLVYSACISSLSNAERANFVIRLPLAAAVVQRCTIA